MADEAPNSSEWQWEYEDMESSQENTGMLMYDETKNTHPTSSAALSNPAASLEKKKKKDLGTITSSPSFQELDRAIGATLALSLNENEANSNMKSYSRSTFNQKVDRGSPRTKKNVQARNPSRVSTSPDANSVGIASSRADLKPFCAETESRAIILYHSPMTNPAQIRVACQKFGVLHYMRPEFHSTGITLLCYFDLRVAVTAQAELATELAHDKEVSAHFSIMLQAANKIDESRLILRNFPAGRTESDVEEIFKNYGQLKSIQRIFSGKTQGNGTKANFEFVVEFFNIQDARLAASELYSSSSKLWDSKTEISLATIDKREQSLCLQLLTILSRWRGWLPSPSQQMMPMPVSMPGTSMSRPMYQYPQYSSVMMGDSQGQSSHVMLPSYEQMAYNNQNFYGAAGHGSYEFPQHLMPMYSNVRVLPQDMMQAPYETAQERQQVEWMNSIPPTNAYEPYHSGPGPPMFREKFMRRSGPYNIARAHHSDRPFYHDGGYGQPKNSEARVDEQSDFTLNIAKLRSGEEQRTTLMIRNIPNKYTQNNVLKEINVQHSGTYDFFYLPIDFKNKCNVGYAFINFMEPAFIAPFVESFDGCRWKHFNSEKVCALTFARIQGKAAMISRFQNSSLLEKDNEYRPLLFRSSGTDKGAPELFPVGPKARRKNVHEEDGMSKGVPLKNVIEDPDGA